MSLTTLIEQEFIHNYFVPKVKSMPSLKLALRNSINIAKHRGTIVQTNEAMKMKIAKQSLKFHASKPFNKY